MRKIVLIAHNLRSCHNVGSLLRTAEGFGIDKVYLTGYTPYPWSNNDERMPHIALKIDKQIHKTALDAEKLVDWEHSENVFQVIENLKSDGYRVVALEQTTISTKLPGYKCPEKVAIVVGREVEGVETDVIAASDECIEIPMFGKKESFNVVQAAAMALYHCRLS